MHFKNISIANAQQLQNSLSPSKQFYTCYHLKSSGIDRQFSSNAVCDCFYTLYVQFILYTYTVTQFFHSVHSVVSMKSLRMLRHFLKYTKHLVLIRFIFLIHKAANCKDKFTVIYPSFLHVYINYCISLFSAHRKSQLASLQRVL